MGAGSKKKAYTYLKRMVFITYMEFITVTENIRMGVWWWDTGGNQLGKKGTFEYGEIAGHRKYKLPVDDLLII